MAWVVTWEPRAVDEAASLLEQDPQDVRALLEATDGLASGPTAAGARPWGTHHYRLHRESWRILFRVDEQTRTIHIEHIGRTA